MKFFFDHIPYVSDHTIALVGIGAVFVVPIIIGVVNDWRRSPLRRKKDHQ